MSEKKVSPAALELIQRAKKAGWRHVRTTATAEVYQKGVGTAMRQINIPLYDDMLDYEWALSDAWRTLNCGTGKARMTEWRDGHGSLVCGDGYTKLAHYEDTGLEPEGVTSLQTAMEELLTGIAVRIYGKQMFFAEPDGRWYSRCDGAYHSAEEIAQKALDMLDEFETERD